MPTIYIMRSPIAQQVFLVSSGRTYLSSVLNIIAPVNVADISDLMQSGCVLLTPRNNPNALTNPTGSDDFRAGYGVGSIWINVASAPVLVYVCTNMSSSPGSATWTAVATTTGSVIGYIVQNVTSNSDFVISSPTTYVAVKQTVPTAVNIGLPSSPPGGYPVLIKDSLGVCTLHNFTVLTLDGSTIDGQSTFVMNQSFQANLFVADGTGNWGVSG